MEESVFLENQATWCQGFSDSLYYTNGCLLSAVCIFVKYHTLKCQAGAWREINKLASSLQDRKVASIIPLCCFPFQPPLPPTSLLLRWGGTEGLEQLNEVRRKSCVGLVCINFPPGLCCAGKDLEIPVLSLTCHLRQSQTAYWRFNRSFPPPNIRVCTCYHGFLSTRDTNKCFWLSGAWETLGM